jgi:hypothetical protein
MVRTLRWVGRLAAFGALALLLSACLKLDMDLEVSSDDTVSGTVIFGVQKELLDLTGGSIDDIIGTDSPLPEGIEGVTVEDYEDDEFAGQQFTFDAVPLAEFNMGESEEELRIERQGDTFVVSGVLDLSTGVTGTTGGLDPEQFLQGAQLRVRITFPGEVTSSNGQVDGNTVTWEPEVGERLELQATASAIDSGGSSNLTMWLIIGGAILLAIIVIAVVLSQRRKRPPAAGDGAAPEAVTAPPSPAPMSPSGTETAPSAGAPAPPSAPPAPPPPADPAAPPPPPPSEP